jgi:putative oxidoreductase
MDIGLLVLRVVLGLTLAAHGGQKLFGWFGGPGIDGMAGWLGSIGFRAPRLNAALAGLSEFGGGLLLAAGLLTPIGAAAGFAVMAVAGFSAHAKAGFFAQKGGYEYTLVLALAALSLGFTGAGALSLDAALGLPLAGARWGLAALIGGTLGFIMPLATRRRPARATA